MHVSGAVMQNVEDNFFCKFDFFVCTASILSSLQSLVSWRPAVLSGVSVKQPAVPARASVTGACEHGKPYGKMKFSFLKKIESDFLKTPVSTCTKEDSLAKG